MNKTRTFATNRVIVTSDAMRTEWVAVGATETEAKKILVATFWRKVKEWGWDPGIEGGPGRSRRSVEAFDEWYGMHTFDTAAGSVFCDGSVVRS